MFKKHYFSHIVNYCSTTIPSLSEIPAVIRKMRCTQANFWLLLCRNSVINNS